MSRLHNSQRERQLEVAERIRQLRGPKPQPVIASEVGVGLRAYQHWEAGGGISWENLQRLAEVFHVSENYLLYGEDESGPPVDDPSVQILEKLGELDGKLDRLLSLSLDPEAEIERETAEAARQAAQNVADTVASERKAGRPGRAR